MAESVERAGTGAKLTVLSIASVVGLLVAEGALRLFWKNPYGANSVRMIVELPTQMKDVNRRIDRSVIDRKKPVISFRTDSRGYIEPARRFDRPDYTVAFLGGSTTECLYVDEKMRFPARASFLLEQRGIRMNALNAGVSGNNVHQSVNNLLNYVVNDKPDVAVLMEAANDVGHLRAAGDYEFSMGRAPAFGTIGRLVFTRASAYSSIAALIRHTSVLRRNQRDLDYQATPVERPTPENAEALPVEKFRQRLRTFVGVSRAFGITPVLMTQPSAPTRNALTPGWYDPAAQAIFNQAIREVAAEEQAELIDLVAFLNARPKSPQPVFYDGIHVADYGADLYAHHVAERLQQIVTARPSLAR